MDLQTEKNQIIKSLEYINDAALLTAIQNLIDFAKQKEEEFLGERIENYNRELDKAEDEVNQGNFIAHESAIKKLKEWRNEK